MGCFLKLFVAFRNYYVILIYDIQSLENIFDILTKRLKKSDNICYNDLCITFIIVSCIWYNVFFGCELIKLKLYFFGFVLFRLSSMYSKTFHCKPFTVFSYLRRAGVYCFRSVFHASNMSITTALAFKLRRVAFY